MSWEITTSGSMTASSLPYRVLSQPFALCWNSPSDALLAAITYTASLSDLPGVQWPTASAALGPESLRSGGKHYNNLLLQVDSGFVRAFETFRQGRPIPLRIEVSANVFWTETRPGGQTAALQREQVHHLLSISRDHWLGLLKNLGWDEFEVFEVPIHAPKEHESLRQGLAYLRAAQTAFRQGQWSTVATDSRKAIEAAASATTDDADRKAKVEALVRSVVPGEPNEAKRATLSGLMLALKQLRDEAAHGGNLGCQVEREDAEMALTVALSIFRYMGDALARLEGRRS